MSKKRLYTIALDQEEDSDLIDMIENLKTSSGMTYRAILKMALLFFYSGVKDQERYLSMLIQIVNRILKANITLLDD